MDTAHCGVPVRLKLFKGEKNYKKQNENQS
jgi:hypothetical protein